LDQKPTERQNAGRYVEISLSIDVYFPQQPFNNRMLRDILDNSQASRLQLDLARKLKDHAHSGLIPLSNEEANYLDTLYDPIGIDYGNIRRDRVDETTRQRLVEARLGQGRFRYQVLEKWGQRCVVSGCAVEEILRASHIKPWRESNNDERLNPANGLLLTANLDALFDRHLISFENDGRMLVSLNISPTEREILEIPRNLRSDLVLGEQERHFLCQHRGMHEVANQRELLTSSAAERARYHAR
jgi:hypothetical protein